MPWISRSYLKAHLIKRLVNNDLNQRPTARDLLKEINGMSEPYSLDEDTNLTIKKLRDELTLKDEEIALLKKEISMLQVKSDA